MIIAILPDILAKLVMTGTTKPRASLWLRLQQKPKSTGVVLPQTGQEVIALPDAWPQPEIPVWKDLEYRNKLPLPSWHQWQLNCGPMNQGFSPNWQGTSS